MPCIINCHRINILITASTSASSSTTGEYDPKTLSIKFNNPAINKKLATWARTRDLVQKTIDSRDEFTTDKEYETALSEMMHDAETIKQHLMDDNLVVHKNTEGIYIKTAQ